MLNPCSFCSANCCKEYTITITSFDIIRITQKTGKDPKEFAKLYQAKLLNQDNGTVLECYDEKGKMFEYILALKSHPCIFLDKSNSCKIHDCTPLVCRLYPYDSNGKMFDRARCTAIGGSLFRIFGPHSLLQHYNRQIREYKSIVAEWNKKHGSKEECIEFLIKRSSVL